MVVARESVRARLTQCWRAGREVGRKRIAKQGVQLQDGSYPPLLDQCRAGALLRQALTALPAFVVAPRAARRYHVALLGYRGVRHPLVRLGQQGRWVGYSDEVVRFLEVSGHRELRDRLATDQRGAATKSLRACNLDERVEANVDLGWVSSGCCMVDLAVNQQRSHDCLFSIRCCRASTCQVTVVDGTVRSLSVLQMGMRAWVREAACPGCWAATDLWEVMFVTVTSGRQHWHRLDR